jgi:peroxiredoxin
MTKQRLVQVLAVAGIAGYLAACSYFESDWPAIKAEKDRKPAPDFALTDADGKLAKLSDYRGKVVLLNFWATWCGPCEVEIPWFIQFQREYKDRDFAVLGVSADEDGWKSVKPFVAREKVNYRMVIASELVSQQYGGIDHLPTTFLIDREGRVAGYHEGLVSMNTYRKEILTLLEGPKNEKNPVLSDSRLPDGPGADLVRPGRFRAGH